MTERPPERFIPLQCDPWGGSDAAGRNSREAGGALGRVGVWGGVPSNPQPVCAWRWGGEATGAGAWRCQAAAAAVTSAPVRGAHGLANLWH
jgi:hypothetical protein